MVRSSYRLAGAALAVAFALLCFDTSAQEPKKDPPPGEKKGGFGKGGFGKGGFGPGGGFGRFSMPQPGKVLTVAQQDQLKMSESQKKELEALQKEVDEKLGKILTEEQRAQLKQMAERGPGGFGPGGFGPGGFPKGGTPGFPPRKKDN